MVSGNVGALEVDDLTNGATIQLGGSATQKSTIKVGLVADGSRIQSLTSITLLTAVRLGQVDVIAPRIGKVTVTGDRKHAIPAENDARLIITG